MLPLLLLLYYYPYFFLPVYLFLTIFYHDKVWETDECAVCLDKLKPRVTFLQCKHQFHYECVKTLNICPLCRKPIT